MPTITYHRVWCKTCNDFTLHHATLNCKICGTEYSTVYFKDIPKDKLMEQRQRYKASRKGKGLLNTYMKAITPENPFQSEFPKPEIIESDAGQDAIDQELKRRREEERNQEQLLKEEAKKYNHLGRNDICLCGSGKKYKHCHLKKFINI